MQELKILNEVVGAGTPILTYTSGLLFTDEYVYKIRKSVFNSEVDYANARVRKMYTILEKEYNSNLCDEDIYVDTLKIVKKGKGEHALVDINSSLPALSYVLKMKRVPQKDFLIEQLDSLNVEQFKYIGEKLANALLSLPVNKNPFDINDRLMYEYNNIDKLIKKLSSFRQFNVTFDNNILYSYIKNTLTAFVENNGDLFIQRVADGFVKEGHGNLTLSNIAHDNDKLLFINCAHYNELLRTNDIVYDLSTLLVDLDYYKRTDYADAIVEGFINSSDDKDALRILNFYRALAALKRARHALLNIEWELLKADTAKYMGDEKATVDIDICKRYEDEFIRFIKFATIYSYTLSSIVPIAFAGDANANRSECALAFRDRFPVKLLCYEVTKQSLIDNPNLYKNNEVANIAKELYTTPEEVVYNALAVRAMHYAKVGRTPLIDADFATARSKSIFEERFKHVSYIEFASSDSENIPKTILTISDDEINNKLETDTINIIKKVIDA